MWKLQTFVVFSEKLNFKSLKYGFCKKLFHYECTAIPYRASTGPEQGFPCVVNSRREKPVFITGNPCSHCKEPVFITGICMWELLHREIPVSAVVITGNRFAVCTSCQFKTRMGENTIHCSMFFQWILCCNVTTDFIKN